MQPAHVTEQPHEDVRQPASGQGQLLRPQWAGTFPPPPPDFPLPRGLPHVLGAPGLQLLQAPPPCGMQHSGIKQHMTLEGAKVQQPVTPEGAKVQQPVTPEGAKVQPPQGRTEVVLQPRRHACDELDDNQAKRQNSGGGRLHSILITSCGWKQLGVKYGSWGSSWPARSCRAIQAACNAESHLRLPNV